MKNLGIDPIIELVRDFALKKLGITVLVLFLITFSFSPLFSPVNAQEDIIYSVKIEGNIDGGTANYISSAISRAEEDDVPLLIKIDTPGGLLASTEDIVEDIENSRTEIITWVTPNGEGTARAGSAGAFITLAGETALMGDRTRIGSAEPRPADEKLINDMETWIQDLADRHGRNTTAAGRLVTENLNLNATEAERINLVDDITTSEGEVLDIVEKEDVVVEPLEKGFTDQLMSLLTNPTIAFILLLLGILGLVTEITTGGVGVPGVGGGLAIILAFFGLRLLELNTTGILLIVLGIVLLTAEYFEPGFGVFGVGGSIALFLGILLVGDEPWIEVSSTFLLVMVVVLLAISLFVIWAVRRAQKKEVKTGMETMMGTRGRVTKKLDPDGVVKVEGERWNGTADEPIEENESVTVKDIVEKDGRTTLKVEKIEED